MEIKAELTKPYTDEERMNFIIENNHKLGYLIEEAETSLQALGYTEEELMEQKQQKIAMYKLTRGDVFRGLLQAKGVTRSHLRNILETMPETTQEEVIKKEMALIDFDEALDFYRGNPLIDTVGAQLNITSKQLDEFFETGDYTKLVETTEAVESTEAPTEELTP